MTNNTGINACCYNDCITEILYAHKFFTLVLTLMNYWFLLLEY